MTTMNNSEHGLRLLAVGDIFIDRPAPMHGLEPLQKLLSTGDIVFGNCEGVYTSSNNRAPHARGPQVADPHGAAALGQLGFTVMSLANNHIVDGGHEGLRQTIELLRDQGIQTVGAGANLAAALNPVRIEAGGLTVAVVAYSSVFPAGYEARAGVPGLAPLRAHTFYVNAAPEEWNPGAAPQIITAIDDTDSALIEEAVRQAAERADFTVASIHWGDVTQPHVLTDHEPQVAQLLADAGADLILGHHQHTVRGVGFLEQVPVFFGLGHVACDLPRLADDLRRETLEIPFDDEDACRRLLGDFGIYPRAGYPLLPFHADARRTVVARCDLASTGVISTGIYPCRIGPAGEVEPLRVDDPRCVEDLEYMQRCLEDVPQPACISPTSDNGLAYWILSPHS